MGSTETWLREIIEAALSGQPLSIDIAPVTNAINSLHTDQTAGLSALAVLLGTTNTDLTALITANSTALTALTTAVNNISPIKKAGTATLSEILTGSIPAGTPVKLFSANANRLGFFIYNNSTNSLYFGPNNSPAGGRVFGQLATNAGPTALQAFLGPTIWTGEIWVLRNAGTGGVVGYELIV